jgi:hypothetical protein
LNDKIKNHKYLTKGQRNKIKRKMIKLKKILLILKKIHKFDLKNKIKNYKTLIKEPRKNKK